MLAVTDDVQEEYGDLVVRQAGDLTLDEGINEQVESDLSAAEGISLPVTLVLMLFAFGALIAAGIPVLLAASSVAATIGITAPISWLVPAEPTVTSMIVLIGMAVGVDYSLFYLKREREERARGRTTLDAVEIAAATSGHSIIVSGFAVVVAMAGLYVVGGATFNSLATGAILVVAIAVLGSITVLPALLAKLGRWVDRPRVPGLWRLNRRIGRGGISRDCSRPVLRRPVAALVLGGLVVAAARGADARHEGAHGHPRHPARLDPGGRHVPRPDQGLPAGGRDGPGRRARRRAGRSWDPVGAGRPRRGAAATGDFVAGGAEHQGGRGRQDGGAGPRDTLRGE